MGDGGKEINAILVGETPLEVASWKSENNLGR